MLSEKYWNLSVVRQSRPEVVVSSAVQDDGAILQFSYRLNVG